MDWRYGSSSRVLSFIPKHHQKTTKKVRDVMRKMTLIHRTKRYLERPQQFRNCSFVSEAVFSSIPLGEAKHLLTIIAVRTRYFPFPT
jgi:hypothetical protein